MNTPLAALAAYRHLPWLERGLVAVGLAVKTIPFYRLGAAKAFDLPGLLTVITATLSLLIGLSQGRAWGWTDAKTVSLFLLGVSSLALFVVRELRTGAPLLELPAEPGDF